MNHTLAIVKPDAVEGGCTGRIVAHLEAAGFKLKAVRMLVMTRAQASAFYAVHRQRPFYDSLVSFMTSGPCVPIVLEAPNAVSELRRAIGATDPAEAAEGTVRRLYAQSKERNAVHGSDSDENARKEIDFFFPDFAAGNDASETGRPVAQAS